MKIFQIISHVYVFTIDISLFWMTYSRELYSSRLESVCQRIINVRLQIHQRLHGENDLPQTYARKFPLFFI